MDHENPEKCRALHFSDGNPRVYFTLLWGSWLVHVRSTSQQQGFLLSKPIISNPIIMIVRDLVAEGRVRFVSARRRWSYARSQTPPSFFLSLGSGEREGAWVDADGGHTHTI